MCASVKVPPRHDALHELKPFMVQEYVVTALNPYPSPSDDGSGEDPSGFDFSSWCPPRLTLRLLKCDTLTTWSSFISPSNLMEGYIGCYYVLTIDKRNFDNQNMFVFNNLNFIQIFVWRTVETSKKMNSVYI
jgi:hypothetical protein